MRSSRRQPAVRLAALTALLVGCADPPAATSRRAALGAADAGPLVAVDVHLTEAPLGDVVAALSSLTGARVEVTDEATAVRVTLDAPGVALDDALARVADAAGCAVVASGGACVVTTEPRVSLPLAHDVTMRTLLQLLCAHGGEDVEVADDVGGHVRGALHEVRWTTALAAIAHAHRLHAGRLPGRVVVAREPIPGAAPLRPAPRAAPPGRRTALSLDGRERRGPRRDGARRIDVDFEGDDLADAMETIGRQVGRNILVDPNVRETIHVSLRDIPWREAVDVIARMCRCVVEERCSVLILTYPRCGARVQLGEVGAGVLLELVAAQDGLGLVLAPDLPAVPLAAHLQDGPGGLALLEAIGRSAGWRLELRDGVVVAGAPGWGTTDLDGAPPASPAAARSVHPMRLRASGAPLPALLKLLAHAEGRDLLAGADDLRVDVDADAPPLDALRTLAAREGLTVVEEGRLVVVQGRPGGPRPAQPPPGGRLLLPDGRAVEVRLEATLGGFVALVDGRLVRPGDALLDPATGDALPARLGRIDDGAVVVQVGEDGPEVELRLAR